MRTRHFDGLLAAGLVCDHFKLDGLPFLRGIAQSTVA
jgi:hypothetical protein